MVLGHIFLMDHMTWLSVITLQLMVATILLVPEVTPKWEMYLFTVLMKVHIHTDLITLELLTH